MIANSRLHPCNATFKCFDQDSKEGVTRILAAGKMRLTANQLWLI
jgi:hypothetical protein